MAGAERQEPLAVLGLECSAADLLLRALDRAATSVYRKSGAVRNVQGPAAGDMWAMARLKQCLGRAGESWWR